MSQNDKPRPTDQPNVFEQTRRPAGPAAPGENRSKRTNDERNDPESEAGANEGQPRHRTRQDDGAH